MNTRHRIALWAAAAGFLLLVAAPLAVAQESTERYIPIGASPGISNKHSYVGRIVAIGADGAITVEDAGGKRHEMRVTDDTRIWVDRTKKKRSNTVGTRADCQVGRQVEIMHKRGEPGVADWVKIEAG